MNFLLAIFIYSMILFHWGDSFVSLQDMTHGMKFNERARVLEVQADELAVVLLRDALGLQHRVEIILHGPTVKAIFRRGPNPVGYCQYLCCRQ